MRIIYVTARFPFGPGEAFVMPELAELRRRGHEVMIVPAWAHGSVVHDDAQDFLPNTRAIPIVSPAVIMKALRVSFGHLRTAVRLLGLLTRPASLKLKLKNLALFPKGARIASLAKDWHADHIHAYWCSTGASMAMVAAELSSTPWSFTGHRSDILDKNLIPEKAASARFVRFISERSLKMSGLEGTGLQSRTTVLHVGIPMHEGAQPKARREAKPVTVLCPANLVPVKGHRYLLSAIELLHCEGVHIQVLLAGDGPLRKELERHVRLAGLGEAVTFLGQLSHCGLMDLYSNAHVDIVVLPSIENGNGVHEAIPVSLMEAMSFSIPVVTTNTGGIPELLGGDAGIMVPPRDSAGLAEALRMLAQKPDLRKSLGEAGRDRVKKQFAIEHTVEELITNFESNKVSRRPQKRTATALGRV